MSRESGITRRTIFRSKEHLKRLGYLSVRRLAGRPYHTYVYDLDGLWRKLEAIIDSEKLALLQTGKITQRQYDEFMFLVSVQSESLDSAESTSPIMSESTTNKTPYEE